MPVVHTIPGAADVSVERDHSYPSAHGPLAFELYRPPGATTPRPAVIFVSGYPDPGMTARLGKPIKDWQSYVDWGHMVAARGVVGVTYANHEPGDVVALLRHLRGDAAALGIDPDRIGVWACSGNVPTALALFAHERLACAALLYGYLIDVDGATDVARAATQFFFATPPVTLDELPGDRPVLVVRAGRDDTPGLDLALQRFVAAAQARGLPVTVRDHPTAPHAFDLRDDSAETHAVIDDVLAFVADRLGAAHGS